MATKYRVTTATGFQVDVTLRKRWLPWPSDNVVLGRTIFARHYLLIITNPIKYAPTLRHEMVHAVQYATRGWWWVWTHPTDRERAAHAAETATTPIFRVIA